MALFVTLIELFVVFVGGLLGWAIGYNQAFADSKKWECQNKYNNKALMEISGDCVKYFYSK